MKSGAVAMAIACVSAVACGGGDGTSNQTSSDGGSSQDDGGVGSIAAASARWDNTDNGSAMSLSNQAPPGAANATSSKWHYESQAAFTVGFVKQLSGYDPK
jgi:hypothetical protein